VIEAAFKLQPDVIFVISDASFERGTTAAAGRFPSRARRCDARIAEGHARAGEINFIGVGMKPANESGMRRVMGKHAAAGNSAS